MTRVLGHSKDGMEMAILGETFDDFTMAEIAAYSGWATLWARLMSCIKYFRVGGSHGISFCFIYAPVPVFLDRPFSYSKRWP